MRFLCLVAVLLLFGALARPSSADETWACSFMSNLSPAPAAVSYRIAGQDLTAIWATGAEEYFRVVASNRYGLVAVASSALIEPDQKQPTVAGTMLVINRATKEFRLARATASAIVGQEEPANQPVQGICSLN